MKRKKSFIFTGVRIKEDYCTFRFQHTPSKSLFSSSITGKMGVYDQGGFIKTLASSQEEFKNEIEELKEK